MLATEVLKVRVPPETKRLVHSLAQQQQLTESALLLRLVETMLQTSGVIRTTTFDPPEQVARGARVYVRLRPEDHVLLRERASGRGMAAATYASFLLRAHLRTVTPIPDRELAELKRSVAALGMIWRNLNQIARSDKDGKQLVQATPRNLRK